MSVKTVSFKSVQEGSEIFRLLSEQKLVKISEEGPIQVDAASVLREKYIGLYFSAHWCPPCQAFTPVLERAYKELKGTKDDFEIVFCSLERTEEHWKENFGHMPWLSLPFQAALLVNGLSRQYEVAGIPALVIIDPSGKVVNSNAREVVMKDPQGSNFPWAPRSGANALFDSWRKALAELWEDLTWKLGRCFRL